MDSSLSNVWKKDYDSHKISQDRLIVLTFPVTTVCEFNLILASNFILRKFFNNFKVMMGIEMWHECFKSRY